MRPLIFMLFIFFVSCRSNNSNLVIIFNNVEGLQEESRVICNGLDVGKVTRMDLFKDKVAVDIEVNEKFKIPLDSKFIIYRELLGAASIRIEPSQQTVYIASGDTVVGKSLKDRQYDLVEDTARSKKVRESLQKIGEGLKGLMEDSPADTLMKK